MIGSTAELGPEYILDLPLAWIFGILFQYFAIAPLRGQVGELAPLRDAIKSDTLSVLSFEVGLFGWMALSHYVIWQPQRAWRPRRRCQGTSGARVRRPIDLRGTPGQDSIFGLGGNDRILGLGGNDVLVGGPGDDTLVGGPGNDDLFGQAGKDNLLAKNAGTDRLSGGTGRDSGSWNKKDQAKSVEKRLR